MPVVVNPTNYGKWLGGQSVDPMRLYPVGTAVENVKSDEAGLLAPVAA
jgi:hypothetical protein